MTTTASNLVCSRLFIKLLSVDAQHNDNSSMLLSEIYYLACYTLKSRVKLMYLSQLYSSASAVIDRSPFPQSVTIKTSTKKKQRSVFVFMCSSVCVWSANVRMLRNDQVPSLRSPGTSLCYVSVYIKLDVHCTYPHGFICPTSKHSFPRGCLPLSYELIARSLP